MAKLTQQISVKVSDLDEFRDMVAALADWAEWSQRQPSLSSAEQRLLKACKDLNEK